MLADCRLTASRHGWLLMRNNNGAFKDAWGRLIRFGLGAESKALTERCTSSDLIGIGPGGRFMAVECKGAGWTWTGTPRERAQWVFILQVILRGGIGGFVRSGRELETLVALASVSSGMEMGAVLRNRGYPISGI